MNKKTPHKAYYFAAVEKITSSQLKAINALPEVDISEIMQWMDKQGIYGIIQDEAEYHPKIKRSPSAPYIIFAKGKVDILDKNILAIVGPRNMSIYAQHVMELLFSLLQHYDVVTLSGMAPGVDTLCHTLSLQYNIPTIAVLGGGFDSFLRGTKRELVEHIVEKGGLVLSEYKHAFKPTERSFPQRNRLIAGIADVIFLPEAQEKSGSLITADIAHKIHKPIGAPMQSIFAEMSRGTNAYITSKKITPIYDLQQFIDIYFVRKSENTLRKLYGDSKETRSTLSHEEKIIMDQFHNETELSIDQLIDKTNFSYNEVLMYITTLEINGLIYVCAPGIYAKKVCNG